MKHNILFAVVCIGLLASCADTDMVQLEPEEPASLAGYDYLRGYDVLRNYADFNVGVVIDAADYLADGMDFRIAASNFSEVIPGVAFAHGSTAKANGAVDTTGILAVLGKADTHGMAVFGYPLVSNKDQNSTYLNSRLEPNVIRPDGDDGGYALKMTNTVVTDNNADAQVAYTFARTPSVEPGIKYKLTFMVRGTARGKVQCATYSNGRGSRFTPEFEVTTEWTKVSMTNSMVSGITGLQAVLFNVGKYIGTLYVDDIELYELDDWDEEATDNLNTANTNLDDAETTAASVAIHTSNGGLDDVGVSALGEGYDPLATYVEKTADEKQTILLAEMRHYISSVADAGKGSIVEWGVVCNPLGGTDVAVSGGEAPGGGEFYWADYFGRDYAVEAFKTARQSMGNDARLYICESGMEDNIDKCAALTDYIQYIESRGVRVDGIGVSVSVGTAGTDHNCIADMFGRLAATGKLVKITSLDVDIDGVEVADSATEAQLKAQAELYKYIVETYMQKVPAAQRGGIIKGTMIDSDSAPSGLWNRQHGRKHAYGGFVEGLKHE